MKKYKLLKSLPDAYVGTEIVWDERANAYYYDKCVSVSPYFRNFLASSTVEQSPEWFKEIVDEYPLFFSDLKSGDYYSCSYENQGVYSFRFGFDGYHNTKNGFSEKSGYFTPNNGFKKFKMLDEEGIDFLNRNLKKYKHFTLDDMKQCFEESRLTHCMTGFKHDTFNDYIKKWK